jgi:hypothetical protein
LEQNGGCYGQAMSTLCNILYNISSLKKSPSPPSSMRGVLFLELWKLHS